MLKGFLIRLHAYNLATHPVDLLFHLEDLVDFPRTLGHQVAEALLGLARVFQACGQVSVLLRDVLAGLRFRFNAAQSPQFAQRRGKLRRWNPQRGLKRLRFVFRSVDRELRRVAVMPRKNGVQICA